MFKLSRIALVLSLFSFAASQTSVTKIPGDLYIKGATYHKALDGLRLMVMDTSKQVLANPPLVTFGFLYGQSPGAVGSTAAAGNGQILIGSTAANPVLGNLTGTANQISVSQGAGTLGLSLPSIFVLPGSFKSAGPDTLLNLSGVGTRMVVADAAGAIATQSIPSGGSLANPTGTIGLTANNGVLTTAMRSDGTPALSQSIVPTWTGAHTHSALLTANASISIPTATGVVSTISASSRNVIGRAGTVLNIGDNGGWTNLAYQVTSGGTHSFSVAGTDRFTVAAGGGTVDGGLVVSGTGTAADAKLYVTAADGLAVRGKAGSSYDLALMTPAGTYVLRSPTGTNTAQMVGNASVGGTFTVTGVNTFTDLSGSGTRMVVADASGVVSTQTIPSGSSLANPTGTIGLTANNGVLTTGMRSDGTPALSQAIVPTWTGVHTFSDSTIHTGNIRVTRSASGALVSAVIANTSNTSSSNAYLKIYGGGSSGGDQAIVFDQDGAGSTGYAIGRNRSSGEFRMTNDPSSVSNAGTFFAYGSARITMSVEVTVTRSVAITDSLSVGKVARFSDSVTVVGKLRHKATIKDTSALSSSSNLTAVNANNSDFYSILLAQNTTFSNPTNVLAGRHFTIRVRQDETGSRTAAFGTKYRFPGGTAPTLTTTACATDYLSFIYNEVDDTWDYVGNAFNFATVASCGS